MSQHYQLFNLIAPVYALFYRWQKHYYRQILDQANELSLDNYQSVLDVGCGTGALCSVLHERGFQVTGADAAEKMLAIGRSQPENTGINFVLANALEPLPFPDKSFDISIASYVAHGLQPAERQKLYREMSRVARHLVILHDFNQQIAWPTRAIEHLERSDFKRFIKSPVREMTQCFADNKPCFLDAWQHEVHEKAAWYIGVPTP